MTSAVSRRRARRRWPRCQFREKSMFLRMKIGVRLALGFTVTVLLALGVGGLGLKTLDAVGARWLEFDAVVVKRDDIMLAGANALGDGIHHFKNYMLRGGDYAQK